MRFEAFIAWKHLTRRRKSGFISLISLISVMGVSVGVMALIVVLGVMTGFDRELKAKIVNVQPHLRIEQVGGLDQLDLSIKKVQSLGIPDLKNVAPFVEGQAILRSSLNATGVIVKGLDPEREDMTPYQNKLLAGDTDFSDFVVTNVQRRWLFFKKQIETRQGGILIGENLARQLNVRVGDNVTLISPFQSSKKSSLLGNAQSQVFGVRGIFRMGMNDFDSGLALIHVEQAQALYHLGNRFTGLSVRFEDVDQAQKWKTLVSGVFGPGFFIRSWYDLNENFFQALKVEKSVMAILLALIILVAAFNIVSTLIMVVMEKTKDIGILKALGATRLNIRKIFVYEGLSVGLLGVMLGAVLGLVVAFNLNPISDFLKETTGLEVFPSDIYYFDRIPVQVNWLDVTLIVSFALIASIVAAAFPAERAARLNPVETLSYS